MNIVFLGNHTVGVRTLRTIHREVGLAGVVAHPADPEDGTRYESVFAAARELGLPVIRAAGRSPELAAFLVNCAPDLLFIADYRYLLPPELLRVARLGAVNLHPSLLPAYRGRAAINWAILRGETELGLTAHLVDEGMDTGDIVGQRTYHLDRTEDVGDALRKLYPLYESLTAEVLGAVRAGILPRRPQASADASTFPRRQPEDGRIDWRAPAAEVWNLVRAVAAPYPGAFSPWAGGSIRVWQVADCRPFGPGARPAPGEVVEVTPDGGRIWIAAGDAALAVSHFELEGTGAVPAAGSRLGEDGRPAALVPHNRLTIGTEEVAAAAAVVRSGHWAGGPEVERLEQQAAGVAGVDFAVGVGSGLAALRLSLLALGVGPGDAVAVPGYSCVALANAVLACGAEPVALEVDPVEHNLTVAALREARARRPALKAAIAVHTFGAPAPVAELAALGVPVIEDCSHAFGRGRLGALGRIAVLSLHATKLVGAGEGGLVLTDDPELARRVREARDHADRPAAAWRLNDKLTDLAAALARCQLDRLPRSLARRDALAARYAAALVPHAVAAGFGLPPAQPGRIWYRYPVVVPDGAATVLARLAAAGITAARPVDNWAGAVPPACAAAFRQVVSLPLYPTLSEAEQDRVVRAFLAAVTLREVAA